MSEMVNLRAGIVAAGNALNTAGERFHGIRFYTHGGEFDDEKELDKYARQAPAVFVTILRAREVSLGGEPWVDCTVGLFAMAKDEPGKKRDSGALELADNLMHWLRSFNPRPTWGLEDTKKITDVAGRNLYHPKLDERNTALWAVLFAQGVKLQSPLAAEPLPDAEVVHIDYDLHPRDNDAELGAVIDAQDDIDLTGA